MGINAEYMGLHPETMATPEHQARIDAARKPPYEMEGAPTSTTQITSPAPATVEKYANGDQKTVADDGDITYQYQGRDVAQYSHHLGTRDGMVITYFTDGSREQVMPNGAILEAATDGSKLQTNPNGISMATRPDGYKLQTNPNGTTVETHPDTALVDGDFPACQLPCGFPMAWPKIKTVQAGPSSTHFIGVNGSDIQQDPDKSILANLKPGACPEADDHYGDKPWALSISPDGSLVQYLIKEGVETHADGGQSTAWTVDVWWKEQEAANAAAKIKSEQDRLNKQAANDAKKKAARDMLNDPNASSDDLQKMANDMDSIGDDEAKGLSKDLTNKAKEKKMEEDLKRVWEEQADDKMKKFQEMLDSSDDSAANIANTRKAAEEAAKMAATSRSEYGGSKADELDTFASELAAKAADFEKPDPTKIDAMEKCEKYREMLEDAEEKYLPDDYLAAVEEAAALAAELAGNQKCSKERRDAEQFVPLLKAKAIEVEKDIKKRIANKYKSYPWMKMKNFLKKQGVDKDEVNKVLDKYNLWVLAKNKGIPLPDNPADL